MSAGSRLHSPRLAPLLLLCAAALALPPACADRHSSTDPALSLVAEPSAQVRKELEADCERIRSSRNAYYGTAVIDEYRGFLDAEVDEAEPRAVLRARLGMELLRVGEEAEAAEMLASALEIAVDGGLATELVQDIRRRLALAQLRVGETSNCIGMHGPASCIVPFEPDARHRDPAISKKAGSRRSELA